ncbi:hypothetical protein HNQ80_000295 [Anaerosolibacter carboniphilus]|uniref:Uncharacterized protein n=1 Tax=Anaerosolibacter carboniphilus TaxID=1417629 RepID=A0A841KLG3_9FIRM|nr:hypothetical protein [Anaerosolibacter carboniphilus]
MFWIDTMNLEFTGISGNILNLSLIMQQKIRLNNILQADSNYCQLASFIPLIDFSDA